MRTSHWHNDAASLHTVAKKIIEEEKKIWIPTIRLPFDGCSTAKRIRPAREITVDAVTLANPFHEATPSIFIKSGGRTLMIDIQSEYTNKNEKWDAVRKRKISALQIDLSKTEKTFSKYVLRYIVLGNSHEKRWVHNVWVEHEKEHLMRAAKKRNVFPFSHGLDIVNCPLHKREWRGIFYTSASKDCVACEFFLAKFPGGKKYDFIFCTGEKLIACKQDLSLSRTELEQKYLQ